MKCRGFLACLLADTGGFLLKSGRVIAAARKPEFFEPYWCVRPGRVTVRAPRVGLRKEGAAGVHWLLSHSQQALAACVKESRMDSVHVCVNPYAVKIGVDLMDGIPKVEAAAGAIRSRGKAVIGMKISGEGEFRNSDRMRNESVKYVLESNCVDAKIVGFEKIGDDDDFTSRVRRVSRIGNSEQTVACNLAQFPYFN